MKKKVVSKKIAPVKRKKSKTAKRKAVASASVISLKRKRIAKTHSSAPAQIKEKFKALRKKGREIAKYLPEEERPFYFRGENQLTLIKGKKGMAKKRKRKLTAKQARYFGKRSKRRKSSPVAMHGTRKRRKSSSRRRYFGVEGSKLNIKAVVINTVSAVGGAIVGSMLANKLPVDNRIKAIIPIVAGIILSGSKFGRKSAMVQAVSAGLITIGGVSLVRNLIPSLPMLAGEEIYAPNMLGAPVENLSGGIPSADYLTPASF